MKIPITEDLEHLLEKERTADAEVTTGVDPQTGEHTVVVLYRCRACGQIAGVGALIGCRTCVARSVLSD